MLDDDDATYIEQLGVLVHAFDADRRCLAMMSVGYCDESEDTQQHRVYVVAGLLATLREWVDFSRRWKRALEEDGIPEFHAAKCEYGAPGIFEKMDRDRRSAIQRRFLQLIVESQVWGHASAIQLDRYNEIHTKIRARRGPHAKPYFLAFQHTIEMMALELEDHNWPRSECVSFVFDKHQEYEGQAKTLYDSLTNSPEPLPFAHRLGSLTFDSRRRALPLQAADMWSYENFRFMRDVELQGKSRRWQWGVHQRNQADEWPNVHPQRD